VKVEQTIRKSWIEKQYPQITPITQKKRHEKGRRQKAEGRKPEAQRTKQEHVCLVVTALVF
jgi:hypothetical protein